MQERFEMFTGFQDEMIDFFWALPLNNQRAWFNAHKKTYVTQDYEPIIALLQNVWPTGHAPENAQTADKTTKAVTEDDVNGGRSKSLA